MRRAGDLPMNPSAHSFQRPAQPRDAEYQDARAGRVRNRSPSPDFTRSRTDFLPSDLAASIAAATSDGRLTGLPATSSITSPSFRPLSAAAPSGSTSATTTPT